MDDLRVILNHLNESFEDSNYLNIQENVIGTKKLHDYPSGSKGNLGGGKGSEQDAAKGAKGKDKGSGPKGKDKDKGKGKGKEKGKDKGKGKGKGKKDNGQASDQVPPQHPPPPALTPEEKKKMPCYAFVKKGKCWYGANCHYCHDDTVVQKARKEQGITLHAKTGLLVTA